MYTQPLFDYTVFQCSKRGMLGEGSSVRSVSCILWCSERGARGELICSLGERCLYSHFYTVVLAYETSLILQAQGVRRTWVGDYDTLPQFISSVKTACTNVLLNLQNTNQKGLT